MGEGSGSWGGCQAQEVTASGRTLAVRGAAVQEGRRWVVEWSADVLMGRRRPGVMANGGAHRTVVSPDEVTRSWTAR